ncbi:MAG: guanylate kinase [Deltaproteobacteria bacterium]|jgi:guanylate kinase|nr:guanylate kinase [Deltaproteobacteria bacterium]
MKEKGRLIVISAPSGSGKSSLINAVRKELGEDKVAYSVSHTTRPPRPGEIEGKDYHFVSQEEFDRMVAEGEFLEWNSAFGSSYGTSGTLIAKMLENGLHVVCDVDVLGASNIKKRFPEAVMVFIAPPDFAILKERLMARNTDSPESVRRRLERAEEEIAQSPMFHFLVINDDFHKAKKELVEIITTGKGPPMKGADFRREFFG